MLGPIFHKFNNLSIRARLFLGFGIMVFLIAAASLVALVATYFQGAAFDTADEAHRESAQVSGIEVALLQAQVAERDFFARYAIEGYRTAYESYVVPAQAAVQTALDNISAIRAGAAEEASRQEEETEALDTLEETINAYEATFLDVVSSEIARRGYEKSGMVGKFVDTLEELDDVMESSGDPAISNETDEILVVAIDYLNKREDEEIEAFHDGIASLQTDLQDSEISEAQKNAINRVADSALTQFDALVTLDETIADKTARLQTVSQRVTDLLTAYVQDEAEEVETASETATSTGQIVQIVIFVLFVAALVLSIGLGFVFSRPILRQVREIDELFNAVSVGEFNTRAQVYSTDELGRTADGINAMLEQLTDLLDTTERERRRLEHAVETLIQDMGELARGDLSMQLNIEETEATWQIAEAINFAVGELRDLVSGVEHVAGEVNDVSVVITDAVQMLALQSGTSAEMAQQASTSTYEGDQAVHETIAAMDRIRDNTQETARRIKRLGETSQEVNEIVRLIEDLADRTTVLALNASIQAAAAGEAGRGFAVVAEEVQHLAERATNSTRQIENLIKTIQTETNEAVTGIEEITQEVVVGSRLAQRAGARMTELNDLITAMSGQIQQTADTTVQQTNQSVSSLNSLVQNLRSSISVFKIPGSYSLPDNGDNSLAPAWPGTNGNQEQ
jgi:twitching motility protein PilJ